MPQAKKKDGAVLNKMLIVSWCPDDCGVRKKMLHGSTQNTLKSKLGIDKVVQAALPSECEEEVIVKLLGLE